MGVFCFPPRQAVRTLWDLGATRSCGTCPRSSQVQIIRGQRPALCGAEWSQPNKAGGLRSLQVASLLLMTRSYLARAQEMGRGHGPLLSIEFLPCIQPCIRHFAYIFDPHVADGEIIGQGVKMACPRWLSWQGAQSAMEVRSVISSTGACV